MHPEPPASPKEPCTVTNYCFVPGAIGKAVPGHVGEIITEDGQFARPDEIGEIAVKYSDPVMFLKILERPKQQRKSSSATGCAPVIMVEKLEASHLLLCAAAQNQETFVNKKLKMMKRKQ